MKNKLKQTIAAVAAAAMLTAMPAAYAEDTAFDVSNLPNLTDIVQRDENVYIDYSPYLAENGKYGVKYGSDVVAEPVWDDVNFGRNYFGGRSVNSFSASEIELTRKYNSVSFRETTSFDRFMYILGEDDAEKVEALASKPIVAVKNGGKWGCLDILSGSLIMPCDYKEVVIDYDKIRFMTDDDKIGFADLSGTEIVKPVYDYAQSCAAGDYIVVGRDYGYTVIDKTGREIMPLSEYEPSVIDGKYFSVTRDDGYIEIYSESGEKLFEKEASDISDYADGLFVFSSDTVKENGEIEQSFEICDNSGRTVLSDGDKYIDPILMKAYDTYYFYGSELPMRYSKDLPTLIRVIDRQRDENGIARAYYFGADGNLVLSGYDAQGGFGPADSLIKISQNGKIGFADRRGNIVYEPQFDYAEYPIGQKDCKTYFLLDDGSVKEIGGFKGDVYPNIIKVGETLYYTVGGVSCSDMDYCVGLMNESGDWLLPPIFDDIRLESDGVLRLITGGSEPRYYSAKLADDPRPIDISPYVGEPTLDDFAQWFVDNNYVTGKTPEELRTDEPTTRAEFLALLSRIDGWQIDDGAPAAFPDTEGHWANGVIYEAKNRGLISGNDNGNFDPDGVIDYSEEYEILLKAINFSGTEERYRYGDDAFGGYGYVNESHSACEPVPRRATFAVLKCYNDEGRYYQYDPEAFGDANVISFGGDDTVSTTFGTEAYFFN